MSDVENFIILFKEVSLFYKELFLFPLWRKYQKHKNNIWDSICVFLEGYAFERMGRSPDYPLAAVDSINYYKKNFGKIDYNAPKIIWEKYSELLLNLKLNKGNNPLYASKNDNFIKFLLDCGSIDKNFTLTNYLLKMINEDKDLSSAHKFLKSIRGVGNKISSFFLRDLVFITGINTNNYLNEYLLQPVDSWVKRTVRILNNDEYMSDTQVARWIIEISDSLSITHEEINMGIWYYCSTIVGSKYKLKYYLNNFREAERLFNHYKLNVQNICKKF